jgi:hypothetical protein
MRSRILIAIVLSAFACSKEADDLNDWSNRSCKRILDSLDGSNLTCYSQPGGFFVLEFDASHKKIAKKLTYRKGFPLYIDTLSYIKPNEFRSQRESTTYLIKDTSVLTIHYVKIYHPNSNWQGQTPWIQPYVDTYQRLEIRSE